MKRNQLYSKIFLTMIMGIASLWMAGCSEEKPEACYIEAYTDYTDMVTQTKATLRGSISIQSGVVTEYGFYLSNKRAELETAATGAKKVVSGGSYSNFTYEATGLSSGTTYYYRVFASNGNSAFYGPIMEFETLQPSVPTLGELHYSNVTDNSVDLSCTLVDAGVETTSTMIYGFAYKKPDAANWTKKTDGVQKNEDGSFSLTLDGLSPETQYAICAYVTNTHGDGYSNEEWITTSKKLTPEVSMDDIREGWYEDSDVTATGVKVSGYINHVYSEDGVVSEVGFLYGTSNNLTYASAGENRVVATPNTYGEGGVFTAELVNKLLPSKQYYIRPYAKDEDSDGNPVYGYGEVKSFTTREFESPRIDYVNAKAQGINSISVSVENMTYDGTLVEYGFIWRKYYHDQMSDELTLDNCGENKITIMPTTEDVVSTFSALIENLDTNTEYEIKAYSITSYEVDGETHLSTGYSWSSHAGTADLNVPEVNYPETKKTTYTTMTLSSGVYSYDEAATLTECGFIWVDYATYEANNYNLTLENCGDNKLVATFGENNAFEATLTGLKFGTSYQVAAYVTVTYSNGETRTGYYSTGRSTLSVYVSVSVGNIGTNSFDASGSVGDYYSSIDWTELGDTFEAGFCWATKEDTNPADIPEENRMTAELTDSDNQKTFAATVTVPEESGVTYYVWSYFKCNGGIVYSNATSVTSKNIPGKDDHGNPEIKK